MKQICYQYEKRSNGDSKYMVKFEIVNIIICYNNGQEVIEYIDSMKNHIFIEKVCFVITMNSWTENDKVIIDDYLEKTKLSVVVCDPKSNIGYMNGLLYGYRYFRKKYEEPKFVIMSNTDIMISDKLYYKNLLEEEYEENVGCIGPSIFVKGKNTYDNPVCEKRRTIQEMNGIIRKFTMPIFREIYVYLSTIKGYFVKNIKTESRYVYEVHGCYFILTGKFADKIKNLEYGVLMYSEESYIAELIYRLGMQTFYDSSLEIIHLEHSTTKFVKCSKIAKYIQESMVYIREEFYEK